MSKKLDDLDMEVIQELAKSSQKVQDLIREKYKAIQDIENAQDTTYKKLDPALSPTNDKRIHKRHSKRMMSNGAKENLIGDTKDNYNSKIKTALEEKALEQDKEYLHPMVKDMDKNDITAIIENGRQAYKERAQEKEKSIDDALHYDLDNIDNEYDAYPIFSDFERNMEDFNKTPSPTDDFE